MEFSRFVPAYHAHFGRQLRVAHYGCVKLVELFELIPEAVAVSVDPIGERSVRLAPRAAKTVSSFYASLVTPTNLFQNKSFSTNVTGAIPRATAQDTQNRTN